MTMYRAYVLETTAPLTPIVHIVYARGEKYGDAWRGGNAQLNDAKAKTTLFADADGKARASLGTGDAWKLVKIDQIKAPSVKMTRETLTAMLTSGDDANAKIAALAAAFGVTLTPVVDEKGS